MVRNLKCPVVITDLDQERVDKGLSYIKSEISKLVEKKRMSPETAARIQTLVTGSTDKKIFADANFIIEAIFEELELKKQLFAELAAPPEPVKSKKR